MRVPGLVSITFRKKTPLEICRLCQKAGLRAIEWGGDVHVPPKGGRAAEVRRMCGDMGIDICSYGSYFRLGSDSDTFLAALEECAALASPVIRIWAGRKASREYSEAEREEIVGQLNACAREAEKANIRVALEYHGGTLTDCRESARRLLRETQAPRFYWQPRWDWQEEERLASLGDLSERLSHMHVFTWRHAPDGVERLPLAQGENMWERVLAAYPDGYALIEFVRGDADEALLEDAKTLNRWLSGREG